ncbi:MAG: nucleotide exchange factor GrpE, partial [Acidobacteriota bacterium]|nr:nucleotide exchange factor GrpE [Acidobacteriota bacterium]
MEDDPINETTPVAERTDSTGIERQRDEYYDLLLRKQAEFDNYRKRVDRERQMVSEAAASSIIEELLPLMDDLERALKTEAVGDAAEA